MDERLDGGVGQSEGSTDIQEQIRSVGEIIHLVLSSKPGVKEVFAPFSVSRCGGPQPLLGISDSGHLRKAVDTLFLTRLRRRFVGV